jgi:pimeloyl-ACP methyl ester carboxylesterase
VSVPVDHQEPDGPTVELALVRRPATGDPQGTIFVNPGGPGASGFDFVASGFQLDQATSSRYHLVGFDPRGVGRSATIGCDVDRAAGPLPDTSPDDQAEAEALDEDARAFARACAEADSPLLPHVDTTSVARDLDLLRQAVGDEQLHYYGFSYGTLIGLVYADLLPDRIGHMVLDGVVDPTHSLPDLLRQQTSAFDGLFVRLDAACASLTCPDGGITATYDRVLAVLEAEGPVGEVGPAELESASLLALYDESLWPVYARALTEADQGDHQTLELLSDSFVSGVDFATYAAVECIDTPHPEGAEAWDAFARELEGLSSRFGPAVANELRACAYWPVPFGDTREPVRAEGAAPIVVIGSTDDPATPLENAERVAAGLADGRLVTVDGAFHTSYSSSPCVQQLVADYLGDGGPPGPSTRC